MITYSLRKGIFNEEILLKVSNEQIIVECNSSKELKRIINNDDILIQEYDRYQESSLSKIVKIEELQSELSSKWSFKDYKYNI